MMDQLYGEMMFRNDLENEMNQMINLTIDEIRTELIVNISKMRPEYQRVVTETGAMRAIEDYVEASVNEYVTRFKIKVIEHIRDYVRHETSEQEVR